MGLIPWHRSRHLDVRRGDSGLNSLQQEVNRLFEDFFGGFDSSPEGTRQVLVTPAVDIVETGKSYKISAELPAMDIDDIDISVDSGHLTIKGEKREEKEERGDNHTVVRSERYYGSYRRVIALPQDAESDKAEATFRKGVLHIEIPKKSESQLKLRKIAVKGEA